MPDVLREALERLHAAQTRLDELARVPDAVLDAAHAEVEAARAILSEALVEAGHAPVGSVLLPWIGRGAA